MPVRHSDTTVLCAVLLEEGLLDPVVAAVGVGAADLAAAGAVAATSVEAAATAGPAAEAMGTAEEAMGAVAARATETLGMSLATPVYTF